MLQTRQSALRVARRIRPCTQRRFESSHKSHDSHNASHDAHHPSQQNESFGPGLYVLIAVIPIAYFLHERSMNPSPGDTFLAKWIPDYSAEWTKRNTLHTAAVEQAGNDRALFHNSPRSANVELRYQEVFNSGSPYNKSSSNSVNLEQLIDHYKKKNAETAAKIEKKSPEQIYAEES